MTLQRLPNGSVRIARIDEWHFEALKRIPALADPGDDEQALHRVYPAPFAAGEATEEQQEDWAEYVQPELESLFQGSVQRVARDLKKARLSESEPGEKPEKPAEQPVMGEEESEEAEEGEEEEAAPSGPEWEITVPADHVEDWFRAMNQARLVLSSAKEAHRTDKDYVTRMLLSGEIEVLVHYEMLTALCGWWVEVMLRAE